MPFERTDLDSGIRILTERMPGVRSVTLGAWVGAGSRDEPPRLAGATHFLEHLLFKGTESRSAADIAESFDGVGGDINAFTTKEFTCFYARTLDEDLPMAVEIVADMLQNSLLRQEDVEAERRVVLEEISMHEDTSDDHVHDLLQETIWGEHPLGRRVQGFAKTVGPMGREAIDGYYHRHYHAGNLVIAAAGSLEHQVLVDAVEKAFRGAPSGLPRVLRGEAEAPEVRGETAVRSRDIEQAHLAYGTRGLARNDPRRWALGVLNILLGAEMSSRLFQEIRERRGLAYSVYSSHQSFAETGLLTIYAASAPARAREVLSIVRDEVVRLSEVGITEEELVRGKGHLRGSLVLSLEETSARMHRLGESELCHGEILSPDDVIARIERVTLDDVRAVARDVLVSGPWALAALGPDGDLDVGGFAGRLGG